MKNTEKKQINEAASALGKLGGMALVKKRGKGYMKEISRKGVQARLNKK